MKLIVLNDNYASSICGGEHGLSYYIEFGNKVILFDAGPSDIILRNAEKLYVDLNTIQDIVLSHGHWDHGDGLAYIPDGKRLIVHPNAFVQRFKRVKKKYIGLKLSESELEAKFSIVRTRNFFEIAPQCWFLGEIERVVDFEPFTENYCLADDTPDTIPDDSAMVCNTPKGLVIVTGCSHSGICNIVLQTQKMIPNRPICAIIGGFHLKKVDQRVEKTIEFLKNAKVQKLYPSHCTAPEVISYLGRFFDTAWVRSGNIFRW
ncbi:MAG: MBL fold metallo-hydrolase [Salinivirgaceae bacterium]|nr:MBL fold metallo-hydrolase [Salinivirgaceae bacterium]MDD4748278.1 MBL fold metallo-hydrolase [Salinivirgaceae bacterium]